MPEYLYHLVPADQWITAREERQPYFPPSYDQDGFIHLTKKAELLLPVANHFYKDVPGKYLVLKIDEYRLSAEVKYEPAAPVGEKETTNFSQNGSQVELFPHLYGTIDFKAVAEELEVTRNSETGEFLSIAGLEAEAS
eukprot:jgi/Ulvmu1/825/UM010_0199.1